tara:strand:+ start:90 stop:1691 length:1602 start_codon:yes stop_codon:yes gene_type:complete
MLNQKEEIKKRRTFAIISHPDAGKTTITEKLLLYGGAIKLAGTVKAKRSKKFATSDWMELEKQRGISVTSSVMAFPYKSCRMNLIDTPGHQDFSEDTYRTLTAVDSALMLIDCASGVEAQTKKLFEVCKMQKTPIMGFINKMDRPGKDPLELLEEIENVLGIATYPMNWPIGMGDDFCGVYDRQKKEILIYEKNSDRSQKVVLKEKSLDDQDVKDLIGEELCDKLIEDLELLDCAGDEFDQDSYLKGNLAPIFFGSALNTFGIEPILEGLIDLAPAPSVRQTRERTVEAEEKKFTSFIFKIQANMDPSHRDRVAFMRICSGTFSRGMKAHHVRTKRDFRLARPTQFMAQDRSLVDEAFAGDIVGIHDPGVFKIGDTLSEGEKINFTGIPVFAPEHFYRVSLEDPLKAKQLKKGLSQLSEEGAVQIFSPVNSSTQYIGVVGILQADVVQYRIQAEYGIHVKLAPLPYSAARWIHSNDKKQLKKFIEEHSHNVCLDHYENPTLLIDNIWRLDLYKERNPDITFHASNEMNKIDTE